MLLLLLLLTLVLVLQVATQQRGLEANTDLDRMNFGCLPLRMPRMRPASSQLFHTPLGIPGEGPTAADRMAAGPGEALGQSGAVGAYVHPVVAAIWLPPCFDCTLGFAGEGPSAADSLEALRLRGARPQWAGAGCGF